MLVYLLFPASRCVALLTADVRARALLTACVILGVLSVQALPVVVQGTLQLSGGVTVSR